MLTVLEKAGDFKFDCAFEQMGPNEKVDFISEGHPTVLIPDCAAVVK